MDVQESSEEFSVDQRHAGIYQQMRERWGSQPQTPVVIIPEGPIMVTNPSAPTHQLRALAQHLPSEVFADTEVSANARGINPFQKSDVFAAPKPLQLENEVMYGEDYSTPPNIPVNLSHLKGKEIENTALVNSEDDVPSPGSVELATRCKNTERWRTAHESQEEDTAAISTDSRQVDEDSDDLTDLMKYVQKGSGSHHSLAETITNISLVHDYLTTPLFSQSVRSAIGKLRSSTQTGNSLSVLPQYGLLGVLAHSINFSHHAHRTIIQAPQSHARRLVFTNGEAPWSTFICGSQGAGKSHTLACLLENSLISNAKFSRLPFPLAGLIFHYDKFSAKSKTQICEAAYLCTSGVPIKILVSPSNIRTMAKMYANLPGLEEDDPKPKVMPLYISEKQLNISTMISLMTVSKGQGVPLYMEVVHSVLREMAMENGGGESFSYSTFKERIRLKALLGGQIGPLNMRLKLLESFLEPDQHTQTTRPAKSTEDIWNFESGTLTIIDLSDPILSENDACSLFTICLSNFMASRNQGGKIIALDEAHKFLTKSGDAKELTDSLVSIIRQQRHLATRVIISTQEPTLSPTLLDLSNVTIVHRFVSPAWFSILKKHLAGASSRNDSRESQKQDDLFREIVALKTGEALVFSPTALLDVDESNRPKALSDRFVKIFIRSRETADGGQSMMASNRSSVKEIPSAIDIPMHVVNPPTYGAAAAHDRPRPAGSLPFAAPIVKPTFPVLTNMAAKPPPRAPTNMIAKPNPAAPPVTQCVSNPTNPPAQNSTPKEAAKKLPPNSEIKAALRGVVRRRFKKDSDRNVRSFRHEAENSLGLSKGTFVTAKLAQWCVHIIDDEIARVKKNLK